MVCARYDSGISANDDLARSPRRIYNWLERGKWPGGRLHIHQRDHFKHSARWRFFVHYQQREISPTASHRISVESIQRQDGVPRGPWNVQRPSRRTRISYRPERAVQSNLQRWQRYDSISNYVVTD